MLHYSMDFSLLNQCLWTDTINMNLTIGKTSCLCSRDYFHEITSKMCFVNVLCLRCWNLSDKKLCSDASCNTEETTSPLQWLELFELSREMARGKPSSKSVCNIHRNNMIGHSIRVKKKKRIPYIYTFHLYPDYISVDFVTQL